MNYDVKNMMAWVKGNDVLLDIYLYEWVDAETRQAFNLQMSDNVKVRLVNTFGRTFDIEALPLDGHDNGLVIDILGVYPCGTYSLEITLVRGGRHVRSFESPMFRIVERNADANMTFDIVSGGRRADTEIEMQMVAQAVARGKNAYEMWKELPGNEDKSLQDYIDEVLDFHRRADEINAQESARQGAEAMRVEAETEREAAEQQRGANEHDRMIAEDAREQYMEETLAKADQYTRRAGAAADAAEAAAYDARQAEEGANNAAADAHTAAANAAAKATLAEQAAQAAENVDASLSSDGGTVILTITNRQGTQTSKEVGFRIYKTYPSVAAMNADLANVEEGKFVMIAGGTEDADTGKLFVRGASAFTYLCDLSGAQGIKGDTGNGIASVTLNADYTLTIVFTDGTSTTTTSIRGEKGEKGEQGIQGIQGERGLQGEKGDKGDKGDAGTTDYNELINKPTKVSQFENDANYLTQHQDISGKEDKTSIESVATGSVALSADVSKYYTFVDAIETFAITLPSPTDVTKVQTTVFFMTIGANPAITFNCPLPIYYHDGFGLKAGKTYEVNALFNGSAWVIASVEIVIPPFFAKLTLNNGEVVDLEGSGKLTSAMVSPYKISIVSAEIGELCTSIGDNAFYDCTGLTSITIPNGVTTIGQSAFKNCTGLTSVTIGSSVTSIGDLAFYGCKSLTSVTIGSSVTSIGDNAFYDCTGLTSITIPNGVTTIGQSAFKNCTGLTSVTIGSSVTSIGDLAFYGCKSLTNITIPDSVTSIGDGAFYDCTGLTSITIPNGVTSIGNSVFQDCTGLTSVTIGSSVTSNSVFQNCTGLTSITIGNGVTSIGQSAFDSCTGLTSITSLAAKAPTIQSDTFQNVKTNGTLIVPSGSTGYERWMGTGNFYLGKYNWTKVEQPTNEGE